MRRKPQSPVLARREKNFPPAPWQEFIELDPKF